MTSYRRASFWEHPSPHHLMYLDVIRQRSLTGVVSFQYMGRRSVPVQLNPEPSALRRLLAGPIVGPNAS